MCEMHIRTLDFGNVLKDRLRPPDPPIAQQGIHTRGDSEVGPTVPVQLRGGLRSPNRIVTPTGTTTVCIAGGTACIDSAPDTSSMAMSRTIRYRTSQGRPLRGLYNRHTGCYYIDDPPDMGPYIQQNNIRFYHTICKCTNNIREVIG
jgi:hypothetical protein